MLMLLLLSLLLLMPLLPLPLLLLSLQLPILFAVANYYCCCHCCRCRCVRCRCCYWWYCYCCCGACVVVAVAIATNATAAVAIFRDYLLSMLEKSLPKLILSSRLLPVSLSLPVVAVGWNLISFRNAVRKPENQNRKVLGGERCFHSRIRASEWIDSRAQHRILRTYPNKEKTSESTDEIIHLTKFGYVYSWSISFWCT